MELSLTTDYAADRGDPSAYLRRIAEAGFTHVHWCHHWNTVNVIRPLLAAYEADYLGLCYDAGHGNVDGDGLDHLDALKDRLISVHLHDNDGTADQHNPVFSGTVDWPRLAAILAASAYTRCVSMEVTLARSGIDDETRFLRHAFQTGTRLSDMIDEQRRRRGSPR